MHARVLTASAALGVLSSIAGPARARDVEVPRLGVQVNAGSGALGRLSVDVLVALHGQHALVVSGHTTIMRSVPWVTTATSRGGELAWRWYSAGPLYGIFIGAGVRVADVIIHDQSALRYGPTLDFGWQSLEDNGWTLSAGLGAQVTFGPALDLDGYAHLVEGTGLRPRMHLAVGRFF